MRDNDNQEDGRNLSRRRFLAGTAATAALPLAAQPALGQGEVCEAAGVDCGAVAEGSNGMVVSVSPAASEVGAQVLRDGGNAVDAAIAVQFALNVTQPHSSGIGGGGFMLYYDAAEDSVEIVNSRERAPAGATPDMFLEDGDPIPFDERHTHGNAVGVPGTASGLRRASARYGSRPLDELIDPAIDLAEGTEVDRVLAEEIEKNEWKLNDAAREVFLRDGEALAEGETLEQPDLADTLRLLRDRGIRELYEGEIAEALAETVQDAGGSMTTEDLCRYKATINEPVQGCYRGAEVYSMPPPSSGGLTVIQILNLLAGFDLGETYDVRSGTKYHLLAEAMRLAYADRGEYMGDPEFVDVPMEGLLDPAYVAERRELIGPDALNGDPQPGDPWAYQSGDAASMTQETPRALGHTTHFTVADAEGNLISYTTTIEQLFGSGIMVPEYGFMLNNELTDFDAEPGGANGVEPNKRPLSSMSPTIMARDGEPFLTVGSPGGPTIITSVAQTILHHLEYGLSLADAIDEPSIYAPESPAITLWEESIPEAAREEAAVLGNEWSDESGPIGNVNMLRADDGYEGAADQTRDGLAVGLDEE
ncbi:gamma-glutamyltranspeptidase [Halalkalicoccus paucihalophilus]|uniref:Gamma-glutamyltranspeptidase n=1 Tax=Halalkalicoccus paucihalophilus TaxID=1008153 RepID=A0A151ACY9_9EURY|nr:gamma-glutamyltransferase [Halalkalicoccus paucihalophilus]KYH25489.1 gamma-glutamyltranspeptidase [Halalkalicoccus paucihalophilus]